MSVETGLSVAALRSFASLVPMLLAGTLWLTATRRVRGAAFLSMLWNVVALMLVNALAVQQQWWSFGTEGAMWAGVPVDVILGWAALWGAVPVLSMEWVRPEVTVCVLVVADVFAMGSLRPLVTLESTWWWGELLAVSVALAPGVVLGVLTARERALRVRASLQVVLFGMLIGFVIPTVAFELGGTGWLFRLREVGGVFDWLLIQIGVLISIFALRAVTEFATVGGGTPFPWDPPKRMVVIGPYAYVANPMQMSAVALLVIAAALFREPSIVVAAVVGVAFGAGLAAWHELTELDDRFGPAWLDYRASVREWSPRWTPVNLAPATLYASVTCDPCSRVGQWFERRAPTGLVVAAAETHPDELTRVRYEGAVTLTGTRAVAAALEHVSLGWALVGWTMRAPVLGWFLQLLVDACGGGPRTIDASD